MARRVAARPRPRPSHGVWLLSIVELPGVLTPGARVRDSNGMMAQVFEVRRLRQKSSAIAGQSRDLFAVLHAGAGSIMVCVCLVGRQKQWALGMEPRS